MKDATIQSARTEARRIEYDESRFHRSLHNLFPLETKIQWGKNKSKKFVDELAQ